ncbi:unnamed protein product [Staurois parvus]|uniref:Uncharacterized protein n=1 Tax=Staurois parvus TaxID=386267 RepID=A0ABN9DUC8_9NEOB|nr:unnamed protein product [Staurois parvus]
MLSLVCIAREVFFFSSDSESDQHRANQHCSDRGKGFCVLLEHKKSLIQALTSALLNTNRSHKTALTDDDCISMFCVLWENR